MEHRADLVNTLSTDCTHIKQFPACRSWVFSFILWYDDVITWKHFPCYWPFVRGIHRSPVNSPHKGQWRWALMFSLICAWRNGWINNGEAGDLRRHRAHCDVVVMIWVGTFTCTLFLPDPSQTKRDKVRVGKLSEMVSHCYLHMYRTLPWSRIHNKQMILSVIPCAFMEPF